MSSLETIFTQIESVPDFTGYKVESVNDRNAWGDTPLHIVSGWGDCEAIAVLIAAGADLNAQGESGFTPLHCAVEQDQPAALEVLLRAGAAHLRDDDGCTPLVLAETLGHDEIVAVFRRYGIRELR